MHSRHYPIKESVFLATIEPLILAYKKPAGRPPKSSHYNTFLWDIVHITYGDSLARFTIVFWQLAYNIYTLQAVER